MALGAYSQFVNTRYRKASAPYALLLGRPSFGNPIPSATQFRPRPRRRPLARLVATLLLVDFGERGRRRRERALGVLAPQEWRRAAIAVAAVVVAVVVAGDEDLRRGAPLQDVRVEKLGLGGAKNGRCSSQR